MTANFFQSLGLPVNTKKTKVLIFNKRGLGPKNYSQVKFYINECPLEICDKYTYLGLLFKPSGSFLAAQSELYTKASKAWFSISHIMYQNKKMPANQSFQLLDSVVMPVGLYMAELLTPCTMPGPAFNNKDAVLKCWENFPVEKINQRACRMLLSVHKRASRLACIGELGRFPMLLKGLCLATKYEWHLKFKADKTSLVYAAYQEMKAQAEDDQDCWVSRVETIKSLFGIKLHGEMSEDSVTRIIKKTIQSKFQLFWKDQVLGEEPGANKLRFYSQLKSCFSQEPYIAKVPNRSQRSWLARIRTSAHNLGIERGRYSGVPRDQRYCAYCGPGHQQGGGQAGPSEGDSQVRAEVDCELHFLVRCERFQVKRACFLQRLRCYVPAVENMSETDLVKTILCPVTPQVAKLSDKYIGILSKARGDIDAGNFVLEYPSWEPGQPNPFVEGNDDESHHLDECEHDTTTSSSDGSFLSYS